MPHTQTQTQTFDLTARALLVYLTLRTWTGQTEDAEESKDVCIRNGANQGALRVSKLLIPKYYLAPIQKLRGSIRNRHYELSLPWENNGYRIVTAQGFMKHSEDMRAFKPAWDDAVQTFLDGYEEAVRDGKRAQGAAAKDTDYPTRQQIESRFEFSVNVRQVPDSDWRVELDSSLRNALQQEARDSYADTVAQAMRDVTCRMRERVQHLADSLRDYVPPTESDRAQNIFRDSTVDKVREMVDLLPGLNLTSDPVVDGMIAAMRATLTHHTADALRQSDTARAQVVVDADNLLKRMQQYGW